jgi:hypothetical protein
MNIGTTPTVGDGGFILLRKVNAAAMTPDVLALREVIATLWKFKALIAGGTNQITLASALAAIFDVPAAANRNVNRWWRRAPHAVGKIPLKFPVTPVHARVTMRDARTRVSRNAYYWGFRASLARGLRLQVLLRVSLVIVLGMIRVVLAAARKFAWICRIQALIADGRSQRRLLLPAPLQVRLAQPLAPAPVNPVNVLATTPDVEALPARHAHSCEPNKALIAAGKLQ